MLRLLTRRSALAICQANTVAEAIKLKKPGTEIKIVYTDSIGDKIRGQTHINKDDIKRKWTLELELGLDQGLGDIAVHCGKDLGVLMAETLVAVPILVREDPRDIFVSYSGKSLSEFSYFSRKGSRIGTSSTRRKFQLETMIPGVEVVPYSGNVNTRIDKEHMLKNNVVGAVIAAAGVIRLGKSELVGENAISAELMVPAMNQGILMAQFRKERDDLLELMSLLADSENQRCCLAERHCIKLLGASCETPIGIYATLSPDAKIKVHARTIIINSGKVIEACFESVEPMTVAEKVAERLLLDGYIP